MSSVEQTSSRSADLDPFRFRWLIPVSAVQVRPANITGQRANTTCQELCWFVISVSVQQSSSRWRRVSASLSLFDLIHVLGVFSRLWEPVCVGAGPLQVGGWGATGDGVSALQQVQTSTWTRLSAVRSQRKESFMCLMWWESNTNENHHQLVTRCSVQFWPFLTFVVLFQWFGDEGQRAASSALPPQRPSAHRLPEENQAVDSREEQLLEEEAAAMPLQQPEGDSPRAGGELQTWCCSPGRNLLGASAAQSRRRWLHGEEDQTLLPDQRAGGSAAETQLHRGRGRARRDVSKRRPETELQSASKPRRRSAGAGERLQRSEHDLHDQRRLFLRLCADAEDCCSYATGLTSRCWHLSQYRAKIRRRLLPGQHTLHWQTSNSKTTSGASTCTKQRRSSRGLKDVSIFLQKRNRVSCDSLDVEVDAAFKIFLLYSYILLYRFLSKSQKQLLEPQNQRKPRLEQTHKHRHRE